LLGTLQHAVVDVPPAIVKRLQMNEPFAKAGSTRGIYKGEPSPTDSVKFKVDFQGLPIQVERPRGFVMMGVDAKGKPWSRRYKYDYGHIPRTLGGDNDGLDVFLGPKKSSQHAFWAVQRKPDGSFDEYKVFLGFDNRDEAIAAYRAHIPKSLFAGMMTMRVDMMHAMLGKNPERQLKTAAYRTMLHEFVKAADVKTKLQPHQQRVVERMQREDQPGLVVVHGLGSGKTLTSIATQEALGLPSQVVAPASLLGNYEKERAKHLTGKSQKAELLSMQNMAVKGLKPDAPLLIVDEAHRARDPSTATFQMLKGNTSGKRLLMSGSPFYNHPVDLAGMVDIAADAPVLPYDRQEFERRYVSQEPEKLPMTQKLLNIIRDEEARVKPGFVPKLYEKNAPELRAAFSKWVDYHPGSTENYPTVSYEDVRVPMSAHQLKVYDTLMGQAPPWVAAKIRRGLPPTKQEAQQLNSFLAGVRQASNTTAPFVKDPAEAEDPKIQEAFTRLQKALSENDRAKAVVYSNFLESGINPYKKRLTEAGIPFGEFTGEMGMKERNKLVRDYNEGKLRTLLLSSAGGEGLDLKGTRLMQVLEPHWNLEKLKQVEGRGARYMSHAHLPEEERKLQVQRYFATRPEGLASQLAHKYLGREPDQGVDEYLAKRSKEKEDLISQFRALLPAEKSAAVRTPKETEATKELMKSWKPWLASQAAYTLPLVATGASLGGVMGAAGGGGNPHAALIGAGIGGAALGGLGLLAAEVERAGLVRQGRDLARKAVSNPAIENELRENAHKLNWEDVGTSLAHHGVQSLAGAAPGIALEREHPAAAVASVAGAVGSAVPGILGGAYLQKYKRLIALNELENVRAQRQRADAEKLKRMKRQVMQLEDRVTGGWNKDYEELGTPASAPARAPDRSGKDW
jgi:hypothetical protein